MEHNEKAIIEEESGRIGRRIGWVCAKGDCARRRGLLHIRSLINDENGWKESEEFLNRLMAAESYGIKDGSKLRLYYGDNEFLYFELLKAL